eukprot:3244199-Rhodomonas_salina.4
MSLSASEVPLHQLVQVTTNLEITRGSVRVHLQLWSLTRHSAYTISRSVCAMGLEAPGDRG